MHIVDEQIQRSNYSDRSLRLRKLELKKKDNVTREPFYITTLTRFYRNKETTIE
jgi:hypothetical protein